MAFSSKPLALASRLSGVCGTVTLRRSQLQAWRAFATTPEGSPIPLIDFGPFNEGTPEGKAKVAREIANACERIGFFGIVNHGVPQDTIDTAYNITKKFFDQDVETKQEGLDMTDEYPYGYIGMGKEILAAGRDAEQGKEQTAIPDINESFALGPYNPDAGMPPRKWPVSPAEFRPAWEAYYQEMEKLSYKLLQAFALGLDLDEDWFADKVDRHRCALRSLNYPDPPKDVIPGQLRASAHTDYGTLTILLQDDARGGLQVMAADERSGTWRDVPSIPGAYCINIGDLMQRWTNDKWVSTLHRVVLPPPDAEGSTRRQSMAFFHNINADHVVEAIDTCVSEDSPAKYPPITAFDHLMAKHMASMSHGKSED